MPRRRPIVRNTSSQAVLEPLLSDSDTGSIESDSTSGSKSPHNMRFFDNLRGWDRPKRYRYLILLALSLSGDGWLEGSCWYSLMLRLICPVQVLRSRRDSLNLSNAGLGLSYGLLW